MSLVQVFKQDMPKSCLDCDYAEDLGSGVKRCEISGCYVDTSENCRDIDCGFIELPKSHGQLKDADKIIDTIKCKVCTSCNDNVAGRCTDNGNCWVLKALNIIAEAPVLIESEK